jgi:hypothetical protein
MKLKRGINIIFCVAIFIVMVFIAINKKGVMADVKNISFVIELARRDEGFSSNVVQGEVVFDTERGSELGKVIGVTEVPYEIEAEDKINERYLSTQVPGYSYVYVEIEARANITDGRTTVGDYEIMVGKESHIRSKGFAGGGHIVKIKVLD